MRGGSRPGAGRPPGAATRKTREVANKAAEEGITPLEFLLGAMRDVRNEFSSRMDAAKAAAPYIHARLQAIELSGDEDKPVMVGVIERRIIQSKDSH